MSDWKMQVRMLTSVAGAPSYDVGALVLLPLEIARAWIAAGLAEVVVADQPEAAMMAPAENAMRRRARGR